MTTTKEEKMVEWVLSQYKLSDKKAQKEFKDCEFRDLVQYHSTLGRAVRNEFKLWNTKWVPEVEGTVDYSYDHPDAVSMRVIEEAWKRLQK